MAAIADARKQLANRFNDEAELSRWAPIDHIARNADTATWKAFRTRVAAVDPDLMSDWLSCAEALDRHAHEVTAIAVALLSESVNK